MSATVIGDYGVGPSAASSSLLVSLVSSWKLNGLTDELGTHDLTDHNSVSFASAGKIGNCATFTATSVMYLTRADAASIQVGDEDFTFACWVKFNNLTTGIEYLLSKAGGNPTDCFKFYRNGTSFIWKPGTSNDVAISNTIPGYSTGVWIGFIMIHDSVNDIAQLWSDDGTTPAASDPISYSAGLANDDAPFALGARGADAAAPFDGAIDNVSFWRKVLSSAERTEWFNGGAGKEYPF